MADQSEHLILSVSTENHESGIVRATLSRNPNTPNYPIERVKPVHTTASSLIGRPVLNAPIKTQRKRPRHEPDDESDGDDSDAEPATPSISIPKRQRRIDSALPSSDAGVVSDISESEDERFRERSTESFPMLESLPDPYTTEQDLADLEAYHGTPRRAAGDLLMRPKVVCEGGFTQAQVTWATCMAESMLLGAKHRFFDLAQQYEYLTSRGVKYERVREVEDFELGDDPILRRIAAAGCWMFRCDGSEEAERAVIKDLLWATGELRVCIAKGKTLEMMCQAQCKD